MRKNELYFDARITRRYFSLPAFIFFVFFLAIVMALPAGFYGGFNLIWENSGPYVKWYFVYCIVVALLISVVLSLEKYLSFDRHIKTLSSAAKKVAEGDFSVYLPIRHAVNDMDYIDTLFMDFNTMVEELGSIETLKNDFAANVSHELKTPLAVIQNYGQLLQSTELTAAQKEYVDSIIESTHRLASLIFNILKLNKLESQKIKPKPETYDLCRQLGECAIGFESIWDNKEIEFEAEMEDTALIEADEELMGLVWNNLLSNAFKFTEAGGLVTLRQYSEEEAIIVEVADTGCGMSREVMKHIFDKFYQGDTSHSMEGNGLGLALALRVLQLADGTITVDSTEGKGSTFKVRLPRKIERKERDENNDNNK